MAERGRRRPEVVPARRRDHGGPHGTDRPPESTLRTLQRQAGNRAVVTTIQRDPPTEADLDRTRAVGSAVPADVRTRVLDGLRGSPRTRTILEGVRRARGDIDFPVKWSRRGTYHVNGEIWLDRTWTEAQWIVATQHEITHLETFVAGRAANITTMGREEFVNAQMADEINAHAAGYVAYAQHATTGSSPQGFTAFRAHLERTAPRVVRNRDWAAMETAARTWVEARYRAGDPGWQTSNTNENYYDYWRAAWDRAHPAGTTP